MTDIEYLMIAEQFPTLKHGSTDDQVGFARAIEQAVEQTRALTEAADICQAVANGFVSDVNPDYCPRRAEGAKACVKAILTAARPASGDK